MVFPVLTYRFRTFGGTEPGVEKRLQRLVVGPHIMLFFILLRETYIQVLSLPITPLKELRERTSFSV
jgi:hypothetical protein